MRQKDPIVEFKKEAFVLFEDMMARIDNETIRYLFHIQVQQAERPPDEMQTHPDAQQPRPPQGPRAGGAQAAAASAAARALSKPAPQRLPDVARQLERKQQRQQKDLQYQTGAAPG